jgi:hypothetical protein
MSKVGTTGPAKGAGEGLKFDCPGSIPKNVFTNPIALRFVQTSIPFK